MLNHITAANLATTLLLLSSALTVSARPGRHNRRQPEEMITRTFFKWSASSTTRPLATPITYTGPRTKDGSTYATTTTVSDFVSFSLTQMDATATVTIPKDSVNAHNEVDSAPPPEEWCEIEKPCPTGSGVGITGPTRR